MPLISIRLPDDVEADLAREAERSHRARSELIRDAIVEYLTRRERERFLDAIARAARAPGENTIAAAEESLSLDNEALTLSEAQGVQDRRGHYRVRRKKR